MKPEWRRAEPKAGEKLDPGDIFKALISLQTKVPLISSQD